MIDFTNFNMGHTINYLYPYPSSSVLNGGTCPLMPPFPSSNTQKHKRVFQGFSVRCSSKGVIFPSKKLPSRRNKSYGGILPSILRSLAENDVEKTLDLYHGKLSPKEQTVILKEQSSWEKVVKVFQWMRSQEEYVPNVIHYNVVLRTLGRAKEWDQLRLCWIEMAKDGVLPTNNTYGMLVDVYGRAGLVKEALLWIKHMKLRGIFPDEVTMNTVLRVLKNAREYDRADRFYKDWCFGRIELGDLDLDSLDDLESDLGSEPFSLRRFLLSELLRTGGRNHSPGAWGLSEMENSVRKPRLAITYNTLIDLYGKAGRLKDAADVFAEMLRSGVAIDTFTFNTMIFICGSHGYLAEAEALLSKMEEQALSPDTKTYNIFISLYADIGNISAALRCYQKITEAGLFPDDVTFRAVLHILCERKMVQEVEAVIYDMEKLNKFVDRHSLPVIVRMLVSEGLIERARVLFEKCMSHGKLSSKSFAAILDVYADKGIWHEAELLFFSKKDVYGQRMEILEYNVMIKAYGKAKLYDKAISLFKGMKDHGTWPDACTYNSLIQMLAAGGFVDQARDLFSEMKEAGYRPSCTTFSAVIASYADKNRIHDAVEIFHGMSEVGIEPNEVVYGALIDGFVEAGNFEEAIQYYRNMEDSGISANLIVLTSLIKAYGKVGSVDAAKHMYEKMKNLGEGPDVVASNSMLNVFADHGMVSEAKLIFDYLKDQGCADGVTFATMMNVYKNMGLLDEAIEVAEEMKQSGLVTDCVTYNKVMACCATSGRLVECGELLHEMVERKLLPDKKTFKVLFTVLKKGGFPTESVTQLELAYQEGKPYARQAVTTAVYSVVGLHALALEFCEILTKEDMGLHSFAHNAAIYAYVASGKTDEALNIFMRMQDEGVEPDIVTYINLVYCYGKAGMVEGIKRIHGQLKYGMVDPNVSLYKAVSDAYRSANRSDLVGLVDQDMRFSLGVEQGSCSETELILEAPSCVQ